MKFVCILIFFSLVQVASATGPFKVSNDDLPGIKTAIPEDIKDLVWNKWETPNFIILSIDEDQGRYLAENIESIK